MTPRAGLQRAPLLGFFALTFTWSWACWALSPTVRPQLPWLATLLMFAGIVSARDDGYGTYASAQYTASRIAGAKFVGFDQGGHVWVGHDDVVMAEILRLLDLPVRP